MTAPRRLDQILSSLGYCSRREAKTYLKRTAVTIDGVPARNPAQKVLAEAVRVEGEPLDHPAGLLVLLHKPAGSVCSHETREGPSVYELLPPRWLARHPRLETIGRLDRDTTGALLLTDDGQLNHRWTSPNHHVEKVYRATVEGTLAPDLVEIFASGTFQLEGEDKPCRPARLEILAPDTARLTLTEGKYHQVKRMFAAHGTPVITLHRERFGAYTIDDLEPGTWRVLPQPAPEA